MLDLRIFRNRLFAAASARRVHQRPGALRADVPVRLLLPGRPGRLADRRRHQADPARARDADRLAARRPVRRPSRLAHARGAGHARERGGPGGDDHAAGPHPLLAERSVAADGGRRLGHVQQPEHGRDDGRRARRPPRHRRRRADAAAEHRRRAVDRVRAGDRHLGGAESDAVRGLLGPRQGTLAGRSSRRSSPTCTPRCGCSRRSRCIGTLVCLLRPSHVQPGTAGEHDAQLPSSGRVRAGALEPERAGQAADRNGSPSPASIPASTR